MTLTVTVEEVADNAARGDVPSYVAAFSKLTFVVGWTWHDLTNWSQSSHSELQTLSHSPRHRIEVHITANEDGTAGDTWLYFRRYVPAASILIPATVQSSWTTFPVYVWAEGNPPYVPADDPNLVDGIVL